MAQAMDISQATKPNSSKSTAFVRSTQQTIKQAYNIYEPLREDSSPEDDTKMDTIIEDADINVLTNKTSANSDQPTKTNTAAPTVQLTHSFEALTTHTDMDLAMDDCGPTDISKHSTATECTDPAHYPILPTSTQLKDFETEHSVVVRQHFPSHVSLKRTHDTPALSTAYITTQTLQAVVRKLHTIRPIQPTVTELHAAVFIPPDTPTLPPDTVRQALEAVRPNRTYQTNAPLDADVKDWIHKTQFDTTLTTHQLNVLLGHVTAAARQTTRESKAITEAEYLRICKTATLNGIGARLTSHKTAQLRVRALYHDRQKTTTEEAEALYQYAYKMSQRTHPLLHPEHPKKGVSMAVDSSYVRNLIGQKDPQHSTPAPTSPSPPLSTQEPPANSNSTEPAPYDQPASADPPPVQPPKFTLNLLLKRRNIPPDEGNLRGPTRAQTSLRRPSLTAIDRRNATLDTNTDDLEDQRQQDTNTLEDEIPALANYAQPAYEDQLHANDLRDRLRLRDIPTNIQYYEAVEDATATDTQINRAQYGILHRIKLDYADPDLCLSLQTQVEYALAQMGPSTAHLQDPDLSEHNTPTLDLAHFEEYYQQLIYSRDIEETNTLGIGIAFRLTEPVHCGATFIPSDGTSPAIFAQLQRLRGVPLRNRTPTLILELLPDPVDICTLLNQTRHPDLAVICGIPQPPTDTAITTTCLYAIQRLLAEIQIPLGIVTLALGTIFWDDYTKPLPLRPGQPPDTPTTYFRFPELVVHVVYTASTCPQGHTDPDYIELRRQFHDIGHSSLPIEMDTAGFTLTIAPSIGNIIDNPRLSPSASLTSHITRIPNLDHPYMASELITRLITSNDNNQPNLNPIDLRFLETAYIEGGHYDRENDYIAPALVLIWSSLPRPLRLDALYGHGLDLTARLEDARLPGLAEYRRRARRVSTPLPTPFPIPPAPQPRSQTRTQPPIDIMPPCDQHFTVYNPYTREAPDPLHPTPLNTRDPPHSRTKNMTPDTPHITPNPTPTAVTTVAIGRPNPPPPINKSEQRNDTVQTNRGPRCTKYAPEHPKCNSD